MNDTENTRKIETTDAPAAPVAPLVILKTIEGLIREINDAKTKNEIKEIIDNAEYDYQCSNFHSNDDGWHMVTAAVNDCCIKLRSA